MHSAGRLSTTGRRRRAVNLEPSQLDSLAFELAEGSFNRVTVEHVGPDSSMGLSPMGLYVDAPNGRNYLYLLAFETGTVTHLTTSVVPGNFSADFTADVPPSPRGQVIEPSLWRAG